MKETSHWYLDLYSHYPAELVTTAEYDTKGQKATDLKWRY